MLLRTELRGLAERAIAAEWLVHGLADGLADGSVGARIGLLVQEEERDRLDRPNDVDGRSDAGHHGLGPDVVVVEVPMNRRMPVVVRTSGREGDLRRAAVAATARGMVPLAARRRWSRRLARHGRRREKQDDDATLLHRCHYPANAAPPVRVAAVA